MLVTDGLSSSEPASDNDVWLPVFMAAITPGSSYAYGVSMTARARRGKAVSVIVRSVNKCFLPSITIISIAFTVVFGHASTRNNATKVAIEKIASGIFSGTHRASQVSPASRTASRMCVATSRSRACRVAMARHFTRS